MNNTLVARIVADVSDLQKGLAAGKRSLDGFTEAEKEAIETALKLQHAQDQASRSYEGLSKSTGSSLIVFQEFNRAIQDAPFGMMGVGNNIQQLASNFGALRTQTGSTKAALTEFSRSLVTGINPAILAITLLTTAWTFWEMGLFGSKETVRSFDEQLQKFVETLDGVSAAQLKGASNAEKERANLRLLKMQAEDVTVSMEDRLEAVDKLQKTYPDYLGNLSKEQILAGNVGGAYDDLTNSIIATAKARAFSDRIDENSIKVLEIEERALINKDKLLKLNAEKAAILAKNQASTIATASGVVRTESGQQLLEIQGEINEITKVYVEDVKTIGDLNRENEVLAENIAEQIAKGARFAENLKNNASGAKTAFELFSEAQDQVNKQFFAEGKAGYEVWKQYAAAVKETKERMDELTGQILSEIKGREVDDPFGIMASVNKALKGGTPQEDKPDIYDPSEALQKIRKEAQLTEAAFDGLGSAIGLAFGSGNEWGRFLNGFIRFAGEVIAQNMAMSKANMVTIGTQTGMASGPLAAFVTPGIISSGIALIGALFSAIKSGGSTSGALGSGMSAKTYGLPKREKGGPVTAGQAYIVGEKRAEVFVPNTNGMIIPSVQDYATGFTKSSPAATKNKLVVEVVGIIDGDVIRLTNKRGERRVNKT